LSNKKTQELTLKKVQAIITSLDDRKAQEIVSIDLRNNEDAPVDFIIVCHGDSTTQVDAFASNLSKDFQEIFGEKPFRIEGKSNALWVIVDYIDIVIHIFHKELRDFYSIEDLWSDSQQKLHNTI
jgi:ribosome-associated protein